MESVDGKEEDQQAAAAALRNILWATSMTPYIFSTLSL